MRKKILYFMTLTLMSGMLVAALPETVFADEENPNVANITYISEGLEIDEDMDLTEEMLTDELEDQGPAVVQEAIMEARAAAEEQAAAEVASGTVRRQELVNYSMQFIGGKYRAGGNDPHTGADCSGFVKYVMENGAGVSMNRSSSSQASQGVPISAEQMRPGDLIFYGNGSRINHVAMYIGDGQVIHASTYSTGIKTSPWNYRSPVKITNVLG